MNTTVVERIYPDDTRVRPQTIAHHKERYCFANRLSVTRSNVLDLGCGTGYGAEILRLSGHRVTGIDISTEAIDYARAQFPHGDYRQANLSKWMPHSRYDLVTFFEVIEHLSFPIGKELLQKIHDCLTDNGLLVLSTPRDINHEHNGWHQSEWSKDLLYAHASQLFSKVSLYGQCWDTAIIEPYAQCVKPDFSIVVAHK